MTRVFFIPQKPHCCLLVKVLELKRSHRGEFKGVGVGERVVNLHRPTNFSWESISVSDGCICDQRYYCGHKENTDPAKLHYQWDSWLDTYSQKVTNKTHYTYNSPQLLLHSLLPHIDHSIFYTLRFFRVRTKLHKNKNRTLYHLEHNTGGN